MAYVERVDVASCLVAAKLAAAWKAAERRAASLAEFKRALVQELSFSELPFPHFHAIYSWFLKLR